jgi:hypothetical protein
MLRGAPRAPFSWALRTDQPRAALAPSRPARPAGDADFILKCQSFHRALPVPCSGIGGSLSRGAGLSGRAASLMLVERLRAMLAAN